MVSASAIRGTRSAVQCKDHELGIRHFITAREPRGRGVGLGVRGGAVAPGGHLRGVAHSPLALFSSVCMLLLCLYRVAQKK